MSRGQEETAPAPGAIQGKKKSRKIGTMQGGGLGGSMKIANQGRGIDGLAEKETGGQGRT